MSDNGAVTIRCSRLPLALCCPQSAMGDGERIETGGNTMPSRLGTAVHHLMKSWIPFGWKDGECESVAIRYSVPLKSLIPLSARTWELWRSELTEHFPEPQTEFWMASLLDGGAALSLTGTTDVLSLVGDEVRIADFKTGWLDSDHEEQLKGYSWLGLKLHPQARRAYAATILPRQWSVEGYRYTREQLDEWFEELTERMREPIYRAGEHCSYCPRQVSCQARVDTLIMSANWITETAKTGVGDFRPELVHRLVERARLVQKAADLALDMARAVVASAGGEMVLPDGSKVVLTETEKREINVMLGWNTLVNNLGPDLSAILKVGKGDVEDAISARAPKGQKGKQIKRVLEDLDAAGAITTKVMKRLELKRAPKIPALETSNDADGTSADEPTGTD